MRNPLKDSRTPAIVLGVLALVVAAGGGALAASGGGSTITVCVHKRGGTLYEAKKCQMHDKKLTWNNQGPQGSHGSPGSQGSTGPQGPLGPSAAAINNSAEGNPVASPNQAGFALSKTITLPVASRLLVFASGDYGFNCSVTCHDTAGLYVDNVPVSGTELFLTGPANAQFVSSMGITSSVLAAGTHTVTWEDNGDVNVLQSGPVNSTGLVGAIATG
jgi:hypothetical protein